MQNKLRLVLVQDNPTTGDTTGNAEMAIAALHANFEADLIVFSEAFLTGYPVQDLVLRPSFIRSVEDAIHILRDEVVALNGPAMIIGAPQAGSTLPFNAAYLIEPSGEIRVVHKAELPNHDVFDERRTFSMSNEARPSPLSFRGFQLGIAICEDIWHGPVVQSLADELADVIISINGSPYQGGKQALRHKIASARIRSTGIPMIYVNQVGGQDELVFDGASFTMNVDGAMMTAKAFTPDVMKVDLLRQEDGMVHIAAREEQHDNPYPEEILESDYRAIVLSLRDYLRKTGTSRVFIGISGGLDSALVATMAADAIGPENVFGVMLPSRYTGDESLGLADDLMNRLGIHREVVPIADAYTAVDGTLGGVIDGFAERAGLTARLDVTRENYQARIRGLMLMGLSNALGGIVLSTGNKSEMSVGYATIGGDMTGGFNPLKSVWKTDAFRLSRWRNNIDPARFGFLGAADPIPVGIIDRPPTAELAEGQSDAGALGEYEALDCVLKAMVEGRQDAETAARTLKRTFPGKGELAMLIGRDRSAESYAMNIARLVRNAQFKRVQACPGTVLRLGDFGPGFRYPVAGTYAM